jgi:DNA adenine methylase
MGITDTNNSTKLKPFLRWAGGKRWFVANHSNLIPRDFNRYIEPFLGSGAVYFYLKPNNALLGDTNLDLINAYQGLKEEWELVYRYLKKHKRNHSKEYYYKVRSSNPRSIASMAARFIYLNRTCWNGLYRVNKQGEFNVPIGNREKIIFEDDCFESISNTLQNSELFNKDFEFLINKAEEGDLIFVDPPYTVRHNNNGFIKYNEKLFSWDDQKRLNEALKRARGRGAKILGTNAFHDSIVDLYKPNFKTMSVSRNSSISSKAETRKKFDELVILNESRNGQDKNESKQ